MKTIVENRFDKIVKLGFHEILKPLGFKKKANNFYKFQNGIGHMINIQKSYLYSKDHIHFTINTGIFLPEYWLAFHYGYIKKPLPQYPTEPECIVRRRIGELKKKNDTWYDIDLSTHEDEMIDEMKNNISNYILPHFGKLLSKEMLVDLMQREKLGFEPLEKLIVFGELGEKNCAQSEYDELRIGSRNPSFLDTLKQYQKKYNLK